MATKIVPIKPKSMSERKYRLYMLATMMSEFREWKPELIREDVEFNMSVFVGASNERFCGTAACALGSAALHPWFNRRGLRVKGNSVFFKDKDDFDAAALFFGVIQEATYFLFHWKPFRAVRFEKNASSKFEWKDEMIYPEVRTPEEMAKRLYRFLKHHYDIADSCNFYGFRG